MQQSNHEATIELQELRQKLTTTHQAHARELQLQRESLERQHEAAMVSAQQHAESEMRQCLEEALAETRDQFREQIEQHQQ